MPRGGAKKQENEYNGANFRRVVVVELKGALGRFRACGVAIITFDRDADDKIHGVVNEACMRTPRGELEQKQNRGSVLGCRFGVKLDGKKWSLRA